MTTQHAHGTESGIRRLAAQFRGELIAPGDPGYEQARRVHNGMIDRHPLLIARCIGVDDVIAAVRFAREQHLPLAVRGGGHSFAGHGTCDGGLVIELGAMRAVQVDAQAATVRVEGGCLWRDVDLATHAFGLAVPGGVISSTGVGGLTLGGDHGHLSRQYGLAIDNLLAAEVVLADGRAVRASAGEHPDLFWALRGGGGNFGVVTAFLFQAHPVRTVFGGPMFWQLDQAETVLSFFQDCMTDAHDDLSGFFAFAMLPPAAPFPPHLHGQRLCGIMWCYTGPREKAREVFAPLRRAAKLALDLTGTLPFPVLNSMLDALAPPGAHYYTKADIFYDLTNEAIALFTKMGANVPNAESTLHIYPINGAAHNVAAGSTAFQFRNAKFSQIVAGVGHNTPEGAQAAAWVKECWNALHPHSAGAAYMNFLMDEGAERVKASFGANYARLVAIKHMYDPDNLFSINQNIEPGERHTGIS